MRLRDALGLGLKRVRSDLRRSLMIMVVLGAILGLVFVLQLMFHGIVRNYIEIGGMATEGKVIVTVPDEAVDDVRKFGGEVLGEARYYGLYNSYSGIVLDEDLVQGVVEVELDDVPSEAVPVLIPEYIGEVFLRTDYNSKPSSVKKKIRQYEEYRENVVGKIFTDSNGADYFVVGLAPGSFTTNSLSFQGVERKNTSILNLALEHINTPGSKLIAIDNGGEWMQDVEQGEMGKVVGFSEVKQAYKYLMKGRGKFIGVDLPGKSYDVEVVAGVSPEVYYVIKIIQTGLNIFCGILIVLATVVTGFTFARLVGQDKKNIQLYYSLGATVGQVRVIYAAYFLELVIGAIVLALAVAIGIVVVYSVVNQELLRAVFGLGFSAVDVPYIILW